MGKNFARKAICMVLALTLVLGTAMVGVFAASSSKTEPAPPKPENTKKVTKKVATYTVDKDTYSAILTGVKKSKRNKKTYKFDFKIKTKIDGKKQKVNIVAIAPNAFSKCKKMKTLKYKSTRVLRIDKKAFKGLKTKKIKVKVTKKMTKKNFNRLKKRLVAAGIPAKNIKRVKL